MLQQIHHITTYTKSSILAFWLISAILITGNANGYGQTLKKQEDFGWIITDISNRLQKGQKLALRDLANIWQKQPADQGIKYLAQRHLLLTSEEFDWEGKNLPTQLLSLYYNREKELRYSEFLAAFYITPIEERTVQTQIKEWHPPSFDLLVHKTISKNLDAALKSKNYSALRHTITLVDQLEPTIADDLLSRLVLDKKFLKIPSVAIKEELISFMIDYLTVDNAIELTFQLLKRKIITADFGRNLLANLTNYNFQNTPVDSIEQKWITIWKEHNKNLDKIRVLGYTEATTSRALFFSESVDYYAWLLATTNKDSLAWIQDNALEDLMTTHHPKTLFYLAGLQYKAWKFSDDTPYLLLLNNSIDTRISVKDKKGQYTYEYTDEVARLNFLIYWSKNYSNYEWSESPKGRFINIGLKTELIQSYEKFFRRLNSPNDSAAITAFQALTEGIPEEINQLMKKYSTLLRTYNTSLPPLKFNILENISYLTEYCRQHEIEYHPSPQLQQQLLALKQDLSPKERFQKENQLIASLTLKEVTMLEYYAILNANYTNLNFSIGRILDHLYSKYWSAIIQDEQQFRLYLLKSTLYRRMTNFGIARLFHNKILASYDSIKKLLSEINQSENNKIIQEAILQVQQSEGFIKDITVKDLLEDPETFKEADLVSLPKFSKKELDIFLNKLKSEKNRKALRKMEKYLSTYASLEIIPSIFQHPSKDWKSNKSASKVIVRLLEQVYGYSFSKDVATSIEEWYALWENEQQDYASWGKLLFDIQLEELAQQATVRIQNINSITQSEFYKPNYRATCLQALKKVKKTRTVSQLNIQPLLSVAKELSYIEEIDFSHRDLDNLTKIMEIDDPSIFLDFIIRKSMDFSIDQKGFLINNLLRQNWLFQWVDSKKIDEKQVIILLNHLDNYLKESEYLTEFEEQATQLNILFLTHYQSTTSQKLAVLNDLSIEEKVRLKWLDIIQARSKFEDIPNLITTYKAVKDIEDAVFFNFLSRDFGLPIYDWDNPSVILQFEERLSNLSKLDLYKIYLKEFGIEITTKKGKLDIEKIYQLLQYDLVIPFFGEGGQYRDDYVYALIKILELHFDTTLEFSPKLNEYQTFFQFNSFARVNAWKQYLLDNKHVKKEKLLGTSFNETEEL